MILSLQAFAPAALLLAGGLLLLLRPSATVFVVVQVAALVALLRLSQLAANALTVPLYEPLTDIPIQLRLDRLSLFFATTAVAATLLVAIPWLGDRDRGLPFGWLALAELGAVCAILAGNLHGLAAGWGGAVAALLMLVVMPRPGRPELRRPARWVARHLVLQLAGAVFLLVAAVVVEAGAGTAGYDSIPVGAVDPRVALLMVAAPVVVLATLAALVRACRQPAAAAVMVAGVFLPMSAYVLARTYDLAAGRPLPTAVGLVLAGGAGILALVFALHALWAPDLGAAVCRLLSALGVLLVAAFGLGGSAGLVAVLGGYVSLEVVAGAMLVLLDAGGGRLPGAGELPRWAAGLAALMPLAALAGLALGFALEARLLLLRRLVELGLAGALVGVPLVLALLAVAAGAWSSARFGGGRLRGRRGLLQVGIVATLLLGLEAVAPAIQDLVIALSAAASRVPLADVRSSAGAALPSGAPAYVVVLLGLGAVGLLAALSRTFSATQGLRHAPDLLPPKVAVVPGIILEGARRRAWPRASAAVAGAGRGTRFGFLAACWLAATALVLFGGR